MRQNIKGIAYIDRLNYQKNKIDYLSEQDMIDRYIIIKRKTMNMGQNKNKLEDIIIKEIDNILQNL